MTHGLLLEPVVLTPSALLRAPPNLPALLRALRNNSDMRLRAFPSFAPAALPTCAPDALPMHFRFSSQICYFILSHDLTYAHTRYVVFYVICT